jgi:hypothetical protein
MAGGRASRLVRVGRRAKDGDLAGAVFELAHTTLLLKVVLPILAVGGVLLIILVAILGSVTGVGTAAAQACGVNAGAGAVTVSDGSAGPVGAPAPPADVALFQEAAVQFALGSQGPSTLAAINEIESNFGTSNAQGVHSGANSHGAEGPMQFEPGTWATYGIPAPGGASPASPYDEDDAVWSAANYLHASGAPGDWRTAIYAYNHAGWYVDEVLKDASAMAASGLTGQPGASATGIAEQCAQDEGVPAEETLLPTAQILPGGAAEAPVDAPAAVKQAIAAGNELIDKPYLYGGGHGQSLNSLAPSYDCSSSTSFVLHAAGLFGDWPQDSTQLESYGQSGPGRWITVYANPIHAFIAVAGIVMDTAWYAPVQPTDPNSGPRWQPASIIGPQYRPGSFIQRHPPGL